MLNSIVLQLTVVGGLCTVDKLTSCEMGIISTLFFPFDGIQDQISQGRFVSRIRKIIQ